MAKRKVARRCSGSAPGSFAGQRPLPPRRSAAGASASTSTSTTARWSRSPTARPRRSGCCRSRGDVLAAARRVTRRRRARRGARRARLPRGRLRPPLRQALALLPRQVPLRDAARPAPAARRAHRRDRRASTRPTRRGSPARARRGRAGRGRVARVRAAVPDRPQGGEGVRHREPASKAPYEDGRVHLPRRGRRHLRRRAARLGRGAARRGARRPHRGLRRRPRGGRSRRARAAAPCGSARCFAQESSSRREKAPQNRMVEPNPTPL